MQKPKIFIVQDDEDANTVVSDMLWLKGNEAYKFNRAEDCLKKM